MADPSDCEGAPSYLGNPNLVKWDGNNVGNNDNIKVPFVSKDVEYVRGYKSPGSGVAMASDRWIEKETWTLHGELIECSGYEDLLTAQEELRLIFADDFKELEVGDPAAIEKLYYGRVVSISFGDSQYLDHTPYEVVIEGYRNADDLGSDEKVTDPVATYTWAENDDGTMTLTYNVSAKGIITSATVNDALDNAQAFVLNYTSAQAFPAKFGNESPKFAPYIAYTEKNPDGKRFLVSDEETIDRVRGVYGLTRVYKIDQTEPEFSVLRYTTNVEKSYGENRTITFEGSIEIGYDGNPGNPTSSMEHLRERYYNFKKSNKIVDPDDPTTKLSPATILSERVEEDELAGLLNFTLVFGGDVEEECINDFDVAVNESAENSLITVRISGQVRKKGPCSFEAIKKCFYGSDSDATCANRVGGIRGAYFAEADKQYKQFLKDHDEIGDHVPEDVVLNPNPLEFSVTEDKNNKTINFSISFDDRISFGAQKFDYTMSISPPVEQVAVNSFQEICGAYAAGCEAESAAAGCADVFPPDCEDSSTPTARSHHYQDLGFAKRGTFGFKSTTIGEATALPTETVHDFAKDLLATNVGGESPAPFLIKNTEGAGEENTLCTTSNVSQTHEYDWLWKSGGGDSEGGSQGLVNSDSEDRASVEKLYFGSE